MPASPQVGCLKLQCPLQPTGHQKSNHTFENQSGSTAALGTMGAEAPDGTQGCGAMAAVWPSRVSTGSDPHELQVFPQWRGRWGWAEFLKKKAKPWVSVVVHVEGVPRSQSVWDSHGQRKLLRPLAEEEVCVPRMEAGQAMSFCGGSWRRGSPAWMCQRRHGWRRWGSAAE